MTQVANRAGGATEKWAPAAPPQPAATAASTPVSWAVDEFGLPDYDHAPDAILFDRLARRTDIVALGALYTRHAPRLYTVLERVGLDSGDAQTALCEVFVDLWRHHTSSDGEAAAFDGSVDAVAMRTLLRRMSDMVDGADPTDTPAGRALREVNGQDHPAPPPDIRWHLMTRLGHPAVDREASQPESSAPRTMLLAIVALLFLTGVAASWLAR